MVQEGVSLNPGQNFFCVHVYKCRKCTSVNVEQCRQMVP